MVGKHTESSERKIPGYLVLYICLVIILLAFFICLNALSVKVQSRELEALSSISGSFGALPKGSSPVGREEGSLESLGIPSPDAQGHRITEARKPWSPKGKVKVITHKMQKAMIIKDEVLFDPHKYEIRRDSYPFLKRICEVINQSDCPVHLEAHTDDIPPQDGMTSNWELSGLRALSTLKFFIHMGNVSPHRLSAFGYSEYRPRVLNNSLENRAKNRRVEIILDESESERVMALGQPPKFFSFKNFIFRTFKGD